MKQNIAQMFHFWPDLVSQLLERLSLTGNISAHYYTIYIEIYVRTLDIVFFVSFFPSLSRLVRVRIAEAL